ncbi:metallophosphoesterase family protein [Flavobacterium sp. RHBU_3]|uniref:metallophosphoesterase family protein n=1 Tax=Flavobacterium sp. RHBU_3 TaxID=3391184 RepID=UPI0039852D68
MKKITTTIAALLFATTLYSQKKDTQIAFLADVHLQDLYGQFTDADYKGITNPANGKPVLMRTMDAQLHSTRIFNENYFAFLAALDDIAKRGVKLVALPGDYTDDGQPIHLRGLQRILNEYSSKYGIQFFITTGNHDPVAPWDAPAGKDDFLGEGGKNQPIFSKERLYKKTDANAHPAVITKDIATMGYSGISSTLKDFGFYPQPGYRFWATPFSMYSYDDYTFSNALSNAAYSIRKYEVSPGYEVPDASYLVEPVDGLWLLALDGNVYIPKKNADGNAANPANYSGASIGYNNVMRHKKHLIEWVKTIAAEAEKRGKTLIAFSHYPMVEYNDGASGQIEQLLGEGKWQMERVPHEDVAQAFADAGIKIHFAGHMHINDTGIRKTAEGNTLFNIQSPSLAAYIPAYKLLTLHDKNRMEVETVVIKDVPRFNELFELYKMEYTHLQSTGSKDIWNKAILETKSYKEFTQFHLRELVRLRFIPQEWPKEFVESFIVKTGYELLVTAVGNGNIKALLKKEKLSRKELESWTGADWVYDLYRLQSADCLALEDIGKQRLKQYNLIIKQQNKLKLTDKVIASYTLFYNIFDVLQKGDPAGNFTIDLQKWTIAPK